MPICSCCSASVELRPHPLHPCEPYWTMPLTLGGPSRASGCPRPQLLPITSLLPPCLLPQSSPYPRRRRPGRGRRAVPSHPLLLQPLLLLRTLGSKRSSRASQPPSPAQLDVLQWPHADATESPNVTVHVPFSLPDFPVEDISGSNNLGGSSTHSFAFCPAAVSLLPVFFRELGGACLDSFK